ncbi:MAG: hypothetical protein OEZ43_07505 [Gammaproteobacteria bacterium]|nr:hypothetical protein [Gammaproteobacteria bacterium]
MKLGAKLLGVALITVSTISLADRGDSALEIAVGGVLDNTLPIKAALGYHKGFNRSTDLALLAGFQLNRDGNAVDFGAGSFYTHRIGDISPQYGFSLGPRLHIDKTDNISGLFLKAHMRAMYELSPSNQMFFEYSPEIEFGTLSDITHSLSVGFRFR